MLPGWRRWRDQCGEVPPAHCEQIPPFHRDVPAGRALADEMHPHAERRHRRPGSEAAAVGGARCPAGPGGRSVAADKNKNTTQGAGLWRGAQKEPGKLQSAVSEDRGSFQNKSPCDSASHVNTLRHIRRELLIIIHFCFSCIL